MSYRNTNWIDPRENKPRNAPCAFLGWSEAANRDVIMLPAVNCTGKDCDTCGYNPAVKERRMQKRKARATDGKRKAE